MSSDSPRNSRTFDPRTDHRENLPNSGTREGLMARTMGGIDPGGVASQSTIQLTW